jgi:hypothetical protein
MNVSVPITIYNMVNLLRIKVSPGHTSVSVCFIPELSDASHTCKYFTYSSINATRHPFTKII